ncbi:MAG TPA: MFS transporter, partial [Candidatus Saccharimonadales bacterium]|nr:MFS transporter [Candidatus Saccharimonadales bacterium]
MAILDLREIKAPAHKPPPVPGTRAWVALGMLCFVYVLNFLDRQLLAILAKPIQDSLHLSDSQLGLVGGLYFALFYCFISIPIGWLADKTNRVKVLSLACALWSAATMACGMAVSYPQFAVARMTVGFGEAGGVPPSYAIISDYFPPSRRGAALGMYNLGPPIGAALGIAFGASIAAAFSWRYAFIILGGAGLLTAIAFNLIVREPQRGGLDAGASQLASMDTLAAGFVETMRMFFSRPALLLAAFGSGATQIVTYGLGNFTTLFLMREKGMTLDEVALYYALVVGIGMSAGIFVSGRMVDRFTRHSKTAYGVLPAASLALAVPLYLGFVWAPGWQLALVFLLGPAFLNYFYLTASVTLVQQEVRPDQRVMSGALLLLIMNFIGLGLGPTYVGAASDYFHTSHPAHSLQLALYTLVPFYLLAILLFLWLARVLQRQGRPTRTGG